MEDIDDMQLRAQLDEITKTIDEIIKRVEEHEAQMEGKSGKDDDLTNSKS